MFSSSQLANISPKRSIVGAHLGTALERGDGERHVTFLLPGKQPIPISHPKRRFNSRGSTDGAGGTRSKFDSEDVRIERMWIKAYKKAFVALEEKWLNKCVDDLNAREKKFNRSFWKKSAKKIAAFEEDQLKAQEKWRQQCRAAHKTHKDVWNFNYNEFLKDRDQWVFVEKRLVVKSMCKDARDAADRSYPQIFGADVVGELRTISWPVNPGRQSISEQLARERAAEMRKEVLRGK